MVRQATNDFVDALPKVDQRAAPRRKTCSPVRHDVCFPRFTAPAATRRKHWPIGSGLSRSFGQTRIAARSDVELCHVAQLPR